MTRNFRITRLIGTSLGLLLIALFSSCETYHFAYPLPVDSKNLYKTPKKLRGFVGGDERKKDGYIFEKHSIQWTKGDTLKIINGIWFSARDTSRISKADTTAWKKLRALPSYESMYSVKFDSITKLPLDTIRDYVIKDNLIYGIYDGKLYKGDPYSSKGDTIFVPPALQVLELGPTSFFRKVDSDAYLLNLRDGILGGDYGPWWRVFLITKRDGEKAMIYDWNEEIQKNPSLIYSVGDDNYFDSRWTRKDILKLIKDGLFEPIDPSK